METETTPCLLSKRLDPRISRTASLVYARALSAAPGRKFCLVQPGLLQPPPRCDTTFPRSPLPVPPAVSPAFHTHPEVSCLARSP